MVHRRPALLPQRTFSCRRPNGQNDKGSGSFPPWCIPLPATRPGARRGPQGTAPRAHAGLPPPRPCQWRRIFCIKGRSCLHQLNILCVGSPSEDPRSLPPPPQVFLAAQAGGGPEHSRCQGVRSPVGHGAGPLKGRCVVSRCVCTAWHILPDRQTGNRPRRQVMGWSRSPASRMEAL